MRSSHRFTLAVVAMIAASAASSPGRSLAGLIPFVSDGSLGSFTPLQNVVFNTDLGTYTIGATTYSGGVLESTGANLAITGQQSIGVMEFNFSSINIPSGVTVTAVGSLGLVLASVQNVLVAGTINLSGQAGGNGQGGGGGGGGGGGSLGLFSNGSAINITATGAILANGGAGGSGGNPSMGKAGGAGGAAGAGGSAGGAGGGISGAGNGGNGSGDVALAGGGRWRRGRRDLPEFGGG